MDRNKNAYANPPVFRPFDRGVKTESPNARIKPDQILGIIPFLVLLFGALSITLMVWAMFAHLCDINDIEFHKVYYLVEGLIISIPSIMVISYLKWALLTCESDSTMFAEMRALSVVAIYPFLVGVIKYLDISSFTTIAFNQMYIHIDPFEVFNFIVVMWLIIESVYAAKRWIECRSDKEQEDNLIEGIFTKEVCEDLKSPE